MVEQLIMTRKEICNKFIKAEKEGESKVLDLFSELFYEFQKDNKLLTELLLAINDRKEACIGDESENFYSIYSSLRMKIFNKLHPFY